MKVKLIMEKENRSVKSYNLDKEIISLIKNKAKMLGVSESAVVRFVMKKGLEREFVKNA